MNPHGVWTERRSAASVDAMCLAHGTTKRSATEMKSPVPFRAATHVDFLEAQPIFNGMSQFPTLFTARRWIKHVLARAVAAAV